MMRKSEIYEALHRVLDPEVGVNIVDLGLVYGVTPTGDGAQIEITMTTPACPLSDTMIRDIQAALREAGMGGPVDVEIVWEPPWRPEMMTAAAREQLGWPAES